MKKIIILIVACSLTIAAHSQLSYFLSNKFWRLKQAVISGQEYNFGGNANAPTLQFSGGSIRGNGGCNAYHTKFTINGNMLQIDRVMSTRMACNALSLEESEYFNALAQSHTIEYTEGSSEFRLINTSNDVLVYYAQFEKAHTYTPPPPPRRERVVNNSYYEEEVKPALSKKQSRRKADLEKKQKRGKLTKAERRELIVLQSKAKKTKTSKGRKGKKVKGKKNKRERTVSRKSKGKKGAKNKSTKKGEKVKGKSSKKSKKKRR
jgi:heat shock protein HslJ